jgi:lipoprotein-anchoring transpeptidase ErfK/SrfK
MDRYPLTMLKLLAAACVALAFPTAALAVSQSPPKPVVGAGTINVQTLLVRSAPSANARVIARLSEFRPQDYRPRYVLAVGAKKGTPPRPTAAVKKSAATKTAFAAKKAEAAKITWYKISVPGRPNGRTGWVAAKQVSIRPMPWQVVVYRESRMFQLWKGTQLLYSNKVAVGAPGMETPTGLYYVTVRFKPIKEPFLGAFAFETSAYSKLSDWPGGGVVGLHGWNDPSVLGRAVSHGCIRVSNESAAFLRDRIPTGTPIRVLAA